VSAARKDGAKALEKVQPQKADTTAKEPEVEPVNESVVDERTGAPGFVDEPALTSEQVVQRRTSTLDGGPEWPADGRYRKVFTVAVPRTSTPGRDPEVDWSDSQHDAMHEANKVAVLQEALNRGLHPRAEAQFDGPVDQNVAEEAAASVSLVYSVEAVPAADDETAASAYTPSAALADQGGSTLPEGTPWDDKRE
jgi:hypothetical protein